LDERIARTIANTASFEALAQFEANAQQRNAITDEVARAIRQRSGELGRQLIRDRTGLNLTDLSPAEEKIVDAVSEYVGVMKRQGKDATRTLLQLRNRGLLESAEVAVSKSNPTQGFQTLTESGRKDISYERIILDHQEEFSPRAIWYARRTLELPNASQKPPAQKSSLTQGWTETLLRWLEDRSRTNGGRIPSFTNADSAAMLGMADMHKYGRVLGNIQSRIDFACYRVGLPPLGLAANAPFDLAWGREDRDWDFPVEQMQAAAQTRHWTRDDFAAIFAETASLSGQAYIPWRKALSTDEARVKTWAFGLSSTEPFDVTPPSVADEQPLQTSVHTSEGEAPYWVFVCNPKKWAIDRFLEQRIEEDSWGIRPSDVNRFAPGQLGIIRVGTDQRTVAQRDGKPRLDPGIYALCEVDSAPFPATGADSDFWSDGAGREPGWPTVKIRYLRTYQDNPLTIERLRVEAPSLSPLLLNGFQAASFPISADDFRTVLTLLGENADDLPSTGSETDVTAAQLAALEEKYLRANPEVKERVSKTVERGPIGDLVKKTTGYKCQICDALGANPLGFLKPNGQPYVEAHHVAPVSKRQIGSLSASNVMTVCANHHRQLHYGGVIVDITDTVFELTIDGIEIRVPRLSIAMTTAKP
jgi:EVE domain